MAIDARVSFTNHAAKVIGSSAVNGATFYLGATWFTTVPAHSAAVFGGTAVIVNLITKPLFDSIFAQPGANGASRCLGWAVTLLTNGITAGLITSLTTGFAITLETAVGLYLSAIVASIVVLSILGLCGCRSLFY